MLNCKISKMLDQQFKLLVENLHVEAAHATIAKAEIIQEMENSI